MRKEYIRSLAKYRHSFGVWRSSEKDGYKGLFYINYKFMPGGPVLKVVSSGPHPEESNNELQNWEHVSVSLPKRCPTWNEMCFIKNIFWEDDETVLQYHPAKEDYVDNHKYCLHLWKPTHVEIPVPPTIAV